MKIILALLGIIICLLLFSFLPPKNKAQRIVNKAIKVHGGKNYQKATISFDFRNRHYIAQRHGAEFIYKRIFKNKANENIEDRLSNQGFQRKINNQVVELDQAKSNAYSNSVNSVIYFALLPFFLNDHAAVKEYLGQEIINNRAYHKIKVHFKEAGGGDDFEDSYIYWFHKKTYQLDYLAYNYHVNGGGARFRVAYNKRKLNGIRFADYINFKPKTKSMDIENFAKKYQAEELVELSRIENKNIEVTY
ncbi:MAG TPA: hypothetical protein ENI82_04170 [Bacteroidetes bacterium]|nr:hypothetical protein [Bacteroidota bacterium]